MKTLLVILFPVLLFGQSNSFTDTLITLSGKEYVGTINMISSDAVKIDLGDGMESEIAVKNLLSIILAGQGEI